MNLAKDARELVMSKKNTPQVLFEICEKKALELCDVFKEADRDIVHAGVFLMDLMLSESIEENKVGAHVQMSIKATEELLKKYDVSEKDKEKIINCIEAHHGDVEFKCIEAEICANADCYKFIHPKGFFYYLTLLSSRGQDFDNCLNQMEYKLEEKYRILSLDYCRDELNDYCRILKGYIKDVRNF